MGIFRRFLGHDNSPDVPEWCARLDARGYRELVTLVAAALGSRDMPGPPEQVWASREAAETLELPRLAAGLQHVPRQHWEAAVQQFYGPLVARRIAGDEVEAGARTLALATPHLRLILMREEHAPRGDVRFDGPMPGTIQVLALDTGTSDRFVGEQLASSWGESLERIRAVAEAQVLRLPPELADRDIVGRPSVRSYSLEAHGSYIGPVLEHVDTAIPDAIGPLGAYIGIPSAGGLVFRAISPGLDLRGDLREVALLTSSVHAECADSITAIAAIPFWRRPSGEWVEAPLKFDAEENVIGSHCPGLAGVLAALDPLELLAVPGWAQGILTPEAYTEFAGLVSATLGFASPEEVAGLASSLSLVELARSCAELPREDRLGAATDHLGRIERDRVAAEAARDGSAEAPVAGGRFMAHLIPASEAMTDWVLRETNLPGLLEILSVFVSNQGTPLLKANLAEEADLDALFEQGEAAIREGLSVERLEIASVHGDLWIVAGPYSSSAALPHLLDWLPDVAGPYGALVVASDAEQLIVTPVRDAAIAAILPQLAGLTAANFAKATWPLVPAIFWISRDRVDRIDVEVDSVGQVARVSTSADLAALVSRLPEPGSLPAGWTEALGEQAGRRLGALLRVELITRLARNAADVAGLDPAFLHQIARECAALPELDWPEYLRSALDAMARDRRTLDWLANEASFAEAWPHLWPAIGRGSDVGTGLFVARATPLDIHEQLFLQSGGQRRRPLTRATFQRWQVSEEACWQAGAMNVVNAPDLIEAAMFEDRPAWRRVGRLLHESEAVGLHLHRLQPVPRHGFLVAICHRSAALFIRLEDATSVQELPAFAAAIATTYRNASEFDDQLSSMLGWLRPDGTIVALVDVLEPPRASLPAGLVELLRHLGVPMVGARPN